MFDLADVREFACRRFGLCGVSSCKQNDEPSGSQLAANFKANTTVSSGH